MKRPTNRQTCKTCGGDRAEVGPMSWSGQCRECGTAALVENVTGISTHSGPAFHRWRRAMAASVGGRLLDEARDEG